MLGIGALAGAVDVGSLAAETDSPRPVDDKWDLSWVKKVKSAKYRAVFDSPSVGDAASRAAMWHSQYASVFGLADSKLAAVLVIRHQGIAQAMDDEFWDTFDIAKLVAKQRHEDEPSNPPKGNPGRREIESFVSKGGIVLACNLAFGQMVSKYRGKGITGDDARKEAMKHLLNGIVLQPSGPFALMRAQDEGCGYMMAS